MISVDLLPAQVQFQSIRAKFSDLRLLLRENGLDAYLLPSADEHLNEYLPAAKRRRDWVSGFTGSAGDLLVGQDQAWLFVDSRYYEQAELEVDPSLIQVSKLGLEAQKTLEETLEELGKEVTKAGSTFRLGFDPFTITIAQFRSLRQRLQPWGIGLIPLTENLVDQVRSQHPWAETDPLPELAASELFYLPEAVTGETPEQKLQRLREEMQKSNADILPVTKLDQIAWLYNLRGWDVPYNPVFIAYSVITQERAFLFTNLNRINPQIQQLLQDQVTLLPYERYGETLISLASRSPCRILLDIQRTTLGTYQTLTSQELKDSCQFVETSNPIEGMKARKNSVELEQMRLSNLKASRAKTRTLKWLSEQLDQKQILTEADVAATVEQFYAEEANFQGLSFNTISGAGPNSSIVHYGTPNPERVLQSGEFLLLDSGAQYASGTTDDTRTVIIGEPTPAQVERYTEVLKAHINCAMQKFPKGTTGAQLDGIARSTLWFAGLDYGHGTGHGVGAFLNVHEGPNGISKRANHPLEPGMITSIEPGFYEPGWGGIRIENLYVVRELTDLDTDPNSDLTADPTAKPNADSSEPPKIRWYGFESLTYIPFDNRLIDLSRLNDQQRSWLEAYNQAVVEKLSPLLPQDAISWLQDATT
ncbi:MAG: aminopeptidase P family protein [Kovacikia sp.]